MLTHFSVDRGAGIAPYFNVSLLSGSVPFSSARPLLASGITVGSSVGTVVSGTVGRVVGSVVGCVVGAVVASVVGTVVASVTVFLAVFARQPERSTAKTMTAQRNCIAVFIIFLPNALIHMEYSQIGENHTAYYARLHSNFFFQSQNLTRFKNCHCYFQIFMYNIIRKSHFYKNIKESF